MTRVLVVEDEPEIRNMMVRLMGEYGQGEQSYMVRVAVDAAEGLRMVADEVPELVIADVRMPGQSGCWLVRQILAQHPEVRCLLMSGFPGEMDPDMVSSTECEEGMPLILKPFSARAMRLKLDEVMAAEPWHSMKRRKRDT